MNIEQAIQLAAMEHAGGKPDLNGKPIILHVLRVMLAVPEELQVPAVLHDIVEDTDTTLEMLAEFGATSHQCFVVDVMTRRKGEKYWDYISRVAVNADATIIKIADIKDNMRPDRAHPRSPTSRYIKALAILKTVQVSFLRKAPSANG